MKGAVCLAIVNKLQGERPFLTRGKGKPTRVGTFSVSDSTLTGCGVFEPGGSPRPARACHPIRTLTFRI